MKKYLMIILILQVLLSVQKISAINNHNISNYKLLTESPSKFSLRNSEMKPSDLELVVGLPIISPVTQNFIIFDKNSNEEATGIAYFSDLNHQREVKAWHWDPVNGFNIIASKNIFLDEREDIQNFFSERKFPMFHFTQLKINEQGVVAGSIELFCLMENANDPRYYLWFWWSKEYGLHLSSLRTNRIFIQDINKEGNVLLIESKTRDAALISNIYNMDEFQLVYYPIDKIKKELDNWLWEHINHSHDLKSKVAGHLVKDLKTNWAGNFTCNADSFLKDGQIQGKLMGRYCLRVKKTGTLLIEANIKVHFANYDPIKITIE